ncbi:cation diffusion facilitator family transporter [Butyrivibrio sp. MC2013]|uniref:cation diffusion facilitator family transporter n=1 Tax=Butyrivibrio sp. MC2013 TaxID=1280686 RepID=UPI00041B346E|nr:cation diffusion facilitator family transporter [Butyrivibrio sp. MC2013]
MDIKNAKINRQRIIVQTSVIGIMANVALAAFKATVGILSNSISVLLDAVNNLSDALSSVITIIGTKLADKKPDKKHPLGHGRIEYLTAMIVAAIILYAGLTSFIESVKKIMDPALPDYKPVSLIIIAVAVVVKIVLGYYVKKKGQEVNSSSLIASGSDASFDAIISASVLASAIIYLITGIPLEAYVGIMISCFIIKAGYEMMSETVSDILGNRPDAAFAKAIKATVCEDPQVHGAFDLFLYNYGPDRNYGSIHIEVDDTLTAAELDAIERRVQASVFLKHGVILTGVGIYSRNTQNNEIAEVRNKVLEKVMSHDYSMQFHGFYVDFENKYMSFDVVLSFDCDRDRALSQIMGEIEDMFPGYTVDVQGDLDMSD